MKRTVIAAVLIIAALILGSQLKAEELNQPHRAAPQPQCVRVLVKDKDTRSEGTGALIGPKLIVTAYHVVKERESDAVEILFPDWVLIEGQVIIEDRGYDVALISLVKEHTWIKPFEMGQLKPGMPLSVQGYGYGPYKQSWGVLSDKRYGAKSWKWCLVKGALARQGDSGGPVIDAYGHYVGTLWGSGDAYKGTMFTPVGAIQRIYSSILPPLPIPMEDK